METLKEKTAKGLFWGGMNNGVQQLLGLAFGIILGRLLDPSDYGTLPRLKGCQMHSTVMLRDVDLRTFAKLGIDLTCDPVKDRK